MIKTDSPLVSICCITYNHESFIRETIDGFLNQKVSFDFEILIHDDASTDGTTRIIREYEHRFPGIVKCIIQKENQYSAGVRTIASKFLFPKALGKYIALCEGDDYWIDPFKLQKQVDYLESNQEVVMTFGNARMEDMTGEYRKQNLYMLPTPSQVFTPQMTVGLGLPTLTMVFRNVIEFPEWFYNVKSGDYFLRLLLSRYGSFYYHNEVFGVYRKHAQGVSRISSKLDWNMNTATNLKRFIRMEGVVQERELIRKIGVHYIYAFFLALSMKKYSLGLKLAFQLLSWRGSYSRLCLGTFRMLFVERYIKKTGEIFDTF